MCTCEPYLRSSTKLEIGTPIALFFVLLHITSIQVWSDVSFLLTFRRQCYEFWKALHKRLHIKIMLEYTCFKTFAIRNNFLNIVIISRSFFGKTLDNRRFKLDRLCRSVEEHHFSRRMCSKPLWAHKISSVIVMLPFDQFSYSYTREP